MSREKKLASTVQPKKKNSEMKISARGPPTIINVLPLTFTSHQWWFIILIQQMENKYEKGAESWESHKIYLIKVVTMADSTRFDLVDFKI